VKTHAHRGLKALRAELGGLGGLGGRWPPGDPVFSTATGDATGDATGEGSDPR
jgi:hypothetical protein